jgi:hypothetical protein
MLVYVRLFYATVPYVARIGYGCHNSLSLTSLSLLYRSLIFYPYGLLFFVL